MVYFYFSSILDASGIRLSVVVFSVLFCIIVIFGVVTRCYDGSVYRERLADALAGVGCLLAPKEKNVWSNK